jgi:hypothetical protein
MRYSYSVRRRSMWKGVVCPEMMMPDNCSRLDKAYGDLA